MEQHTRCGIQRAANGFIVQAINDYANFTGSPEVFATFEDAVACLAGHLGQKKFSETVKKSQALTDSLTEFAALAVAPQLLAIEARMNPGVENLVNAKVNGKTDDDLPF